MSVELRNLFARRQSAQIQRNPPPNARMSVSAPKGYVPPVPKKPLPPIPKQNPSQSSQPLPPMTKVPPPSAPVTKTQAQSSAVLPRPQPPVAKQPMIVQPDPRQVVVAKAVAPAPSKPPVPANRMAFIDAEIQRLLDAAEKAKQLLEKAVNLEDRKEMEAILGNLNSFTEASLDACHQFKLALWAADPQNQPLSFIQYKEVLEKVLKILKMGPASTNFASTLLLITYDISVYYILSTKSDKLRLDYGIGELIKNITMLAKHLAEEYGGSKSNDYIASYIKLLEHLTNCNSNYFSPNFWSNKEWSKENEEKFEKFYQTFLTFRKSNYLNCALIIRQLITNFFNSKKPLDSRIVNIVDIIHEKALSDPSTQHGLSIYAIQLLLLALSQADEAKKQVITESISKIIQKSDCPTLKNATRRITTANLEGIMQKLIAINEKAGQLMEIVNNMKNKSDYESAMEPFLNHINESCLEISIYQSTLWDLDPENQSFTHEQYQFCLETAVALLKNDRTGHRMVEPILSFIFDLLVYRALTTKTSLTSSHVAELTALITQAREIAKLYEKVPDISYKQAHNFIISAIMSLEALKNPLSSFFEPVIWNGNENWTSDTQKRFNIFLERYNRFIPNMGKNYLHSLLVICGLVITLLKKDNISTEDIEKIADIIFTKNAFDPITKYYLSIFAIQRLHLACYKTTDESKKEVIGKSIWAIAKRWEALRSTLENTHPLKNNETMKKIKEYCLPYPPMAKLFCCLILDISDMEEDPPVLQPAFVPINDLVQSSAVLPGPQAPVAKQPISVHSATHQIGVASAHATAQVTPAPALAKRLDFIDAEMQRFAKANEFAGQMMHLALLLENDPQFDTVMEEFNKSLKTAISATDYFRLELWSADPKSQPLSFAQYKETLEKVLKILQNDWSGAGLVEPLLSITFDISVYYVLSAKSNRLSLLNGVEELMTSITEQAKISAKDHEGSDLHDYITSTIKTLNCLTSFISDYFQPDFWSIKNEWNNGIEAKFESYLESFAKSKKQDYLSSQLVIHSLATYLLKSKNLKASHITNISDIIYKNELYGPITKRCLSIYAIHTLLLSYSQVDEVRKKIITDSICNIAKNSDSSTLKNMEARVLKSALEKDI